ncbi:MAG: dihydrolipoamide acetyltransferase family protein, partial [Candidatus Kapaibacterium sp.]
ISTDKVDTEVPSPVAGTLVERLANEGDVMEVGNVLARISSGAAVTTSSAAPVAPPTSNPSNPSVVPAQTATAPVNVPAAAVLYAVAASNGAHGAGQPIPRTSGNRFYSPLVRTIAQAEGVSLPELDAISGTGIGGRVTKNDLASYIASRGSRPAVVTPVPAPSVPSAPVSGAPAASAPVMSMGSGDGSDREIIPMDRVRMLIADHMVRSKMTSPHVTSVAEADITGIVRLRESRKGSFEKQHGFKLTLTPFFVQAIVDAVKQFPLVNVSVDGSNIIRYKNVNLGFATLLPDGNLIVPVIKKAEMLSTHGIAASINDLAGRARSKKLSPDDIQGGTISLTNMGPWGSLFGTPVINQPQTAIIGVYAVQKRPVVREINGEDAILIRHMMYVSITYDHRVIDGALGSGCLSAIVKNLEAMNADTVSI